MCNLDKGLKLCTCAGQSLQPSEVDWILKRKDSSISPLKIMGKAAVPQFNQEEKQLIPQIVHALNHESCFDFTYQAQEDDFLLLRVDKTTHRWLQFRFLNQAWQHDRSTKFNTWRQQLSELDRGKFGT